MSMDSDIVLFCEKIWGAELGSAGAPVMC